MFSPSNIDYSTVQGGFNEREFGKPFEWRVTENPWALKHGLLHEIFVLDGVRFGNIKKTVAYIATDEADDGTPVLEKWFIKTIWARPVAA